MSACTRWCRAESCRSILGGDHSITWPAATAVADVHGYGNVGIVHFDAHADTADIIDGNLASHGTPMRRLIESGAVPGTHFVQVGLRGYWPPQDTFEWMLEQGMTWHTMQEIWERGFKDVMRDAVAEALAKADKLYVSVDIDVLDPAHAPGTGTPEPGGITSADLLRMVRQLCYDHDVRGCRRGRGRARLRPRGADRQRRTPGGVRGARRHGGAPPRRRRQPDAARPACALVDNEVMSGILFFDGACGMCTRSRDLLVKLNRTGDMHTEPLQRAGTAERLGIPQHRLMESVWWLDSSGRVYGGAEAANAAVAAGLGTKVPLLVYRIPGMRSAAGHHLPVGRRPPLPLPGTTPYCESHPVAC